MMTFVVLYVNKYIAWLYSCREITSYLFCTNLNYYCVILIKAVSVCIHCNTQITFPIRFSGIGEKEEGINIFKGQQITKIN